LILRDRERDQLDIISGDAVMLRLVGLSDGAVDAILQPAPRGEADDWERGKSGA